MLKPSDYKFGSYGTDPNSLKTSEATGVVSGKGSDGIMGNMKGIGEISSALSSVLPNANNNELSNTINTGYDAVANAAMSIPGYGAVIGGAMKLTSALNKGLSSLTGGATTINDASNKGDEILSSNIFALTPLGLTNSLTKTKIKGSDKDLAASVTKGYNPADGLEKTEIGGVTNFMSKLFGKKTMVESRKNRVNQINADNMKKSSAIFADNQNQTSAQNTFGDITTKNKNQLLGNYNTNILSAKKGAKINPSKFKKIKEKVKLDLVKYSETPNVIPEGALHARNNNYEGDLADAVTSKGIPVITYEEDGNITQHAEIEHSEIIFNKEVSSKLEELFEKHKQAEDKRAVELECGKFVAEQILENTEDKVGLIDTV